MTPQGRNDSARALALWEDINGLDSSVEVRWGGDDGVEIAEYTVRVHGIDIGLDDLEGVIKAAREHGATRVSIEGDQIAVGL